MSTGRATRAARFGSGLAHSAIVVSLLSKTAMRTSPKDTPCLYCGKMLTARGVAEHERHACKKNPNRRKRTFGKKKCAVCGKSYHAAALRAHMATQHPLDFARATATKKPSSRAAQRREMAARASSVRSHERSTSPKASGERTEYAAGRHRNHSHHPHTASPPKGAPETAEARSSSRRAQSNHQWNKQSHKPTVDRTPDSATRRAWGEMQQKMLEAAAK